MSPISFECVPDNLYELYHIVGPELFTEIVQEYEGQMLYIPKRSTMERKKTHDAIRRDYNGSNAHELAIKYNYTERTIYKILSTNPNQTD